MTVRLKVNINDECAAYIQSTMVQRNISATEAIRRALEIAAYIDQEDARGRRISTWRRGHRRERMLELL